MADGQYCTFCARRPLLRPRRQKVQEVIRYQEMTRVPLAPAVVARADQPARPDRHRDRPAPPARACPTAPPATPPMNVVVRTDDGAVSLLVDEIGDVLERADDRSSRRPRRSRGAARELIRRVQARRPSCCSVLDAERAVAAPTGRRGRATA